MVIRIHFTPEDLARTRVLRGPGPVREVLSSVSMLRLPAARRGVYAAWGSRARAALPAEARPLLELQPGLLAPTLKSLGRTDVHRSLPDALEEFQATPRTRLSQDVAVLAAGRSLPSWAGDLGATGTRVLRELALAIDRYYGVVIAPYWATMQARAEADHAVRTRTLAEHGVEGLLRGLPACYRWTYPILVWDVRQDPLYAGSVDDPDRDIFLAGRGLILSPTFFWSGLREDPDASPVLTFPLPKDPTSPFAHRDTGQGRRASLVALLGRTRAGALEAMTTSCTTSELASRLGISVASASEHAGVLRASGLIVSQRVRNTVQHTLTSLGQDLLNGL